VSTPTLAEKTLILGFPMREKEISSSLLPLEED
jgi:hypothetical protein